MRCSPFLAYVGFLSGVEHKASQYLGKLAFVSARRPWLTIAISFGVCLLCMTGFARIKNVTATDKLWVDQHSEVKLNIEHFVDTFEGPRRGATHEVLFEAKEAGGNVLTPEALGEAVDVLDQILAVRKRPGGRSLEDYCERTGSCSWSGVPRLFGHNRTVLQSLATNQTAFREALSAAAYPDGRPFWQENIMANVQKDSDGLVFFATAMRMDLVMSERAGPVKDLFMAVEDIFVSKETRRIDPVHQHVRMRIHNSFSVDNELSRVVIADSKLFGMSFFLMSILTSLLLGKPLSISRGRAALGSVDIFIVLFGTAAGFGIAMLFGKPFTVLSQVLPFILVGIGMDDAFVITGAFDQTDSGEPVEVRMQKTMERVGMSISLTSVTDMCAFALGSSTSFPAVSWFCSYAVAATFFTWVLHCTTFIACLTLDTHRQEAKRADFLCCLRTQRGTMAVADQVTELPAPRVQPGVGVGNSRASRWFCSYTRLMVENQPIRYGVLTVFIATAVMSVWQVSKGIGTDFSLVELTGDSSYVRDFLEAEQAHWGADMTGRAVFASVVYKDLDFSQVEVQQTMQEANQALVQRPTIARERGVVNDWHTLLIQWAQGPLAPPEDPADPALVTAGEPRCVAAASPTGCRFLSSARFYEHLELFLNTRIPPQNASFAEQMDFHDGKLRTCYNSVFHVNLPNSKKQIKALEDMEGFMKAWRGRLPGLYVSANTYQFYDQYRIIIPELFHNTVMCLSAVIAISVVVLVHPMNVLLVFLVLLLVFWDLVGCILVWGLQLNSISMINLVMAVGLVVDYNMHIVHCFSVQDPDLVCGERVVQAMGEIGPAVFLGVASTLVAVLPLGLAASGVFRVFFKMMLSIIVIGGLHGLVLMPVGLSFLGESLPVISAPAATHEETDSTSSAPTPAKHSSSPKTGDAADRVSPEER